MKKILTIVASTLAFFVAVAHAAPMIEFDDTSATNQTGTLEYDGDGTGLRGIDIVIDQIEGVDTPLNASVQLDCVNCVLNFTTGNNTLEGPPLYTWSGGGSFIITGDLFDGGGNQVNNTNQLLTGTFTGQILGGTGSGGISIISFGVDTKDQGILDFYGVNDDFVFSNSELSADFTAAGDPGGFTANVTNVDVTNTAVPEPASLALFGTGLVALFGISRRRKLKMNTAA